MHVAAQGERRYHFEIIEESRDSLLESEEKDLRIEDRWGSGSP
jgi:hypothetical protein